MNKESKAFGKLDYKLLREQRDLLVEKLWDEKDSILWGVVTLLDILIDDGEE